MSIDKAIEAIEGFQGASLTESLSDIWIEIALQRDAELKTGTIESISHAEFMRRTGGGDE